MNGFKRKSIVMTVIGLPGLLLGLSGESFGWSGLVAGIVAGAGAGLLFVAALMRWMPASFADSATPALKRQYYREFMPPMVAYALVMLCWRPLLAAVGTPWLRLLVALLPGVLVLLVIRAMARYVRAADEMQRRIELESVAIAAALVAGGYMTAGFLQLATLIAVPSAVAMVWVFPSLCMSYGITKMLIARRYA